MWRLGLRAIIIIIVGSYLNPAAAWASQKATLYATMTPEQLGHRTTIGFGLRIATPRHEVPPALTELQVIYPRDLGFGLSELGLQNCTTHILEYFGPNACPSNSLMGTGTAIAEVQIGPAILHEHAQLTIFHSETKSSYITMLINAETITPVFTDIILSAALLPDAAHARLKAQIPLITPLPGAPDIAIIQLQVSVGPQHLNYHEYIHGHRVTYKPRGIPLPNQCPHKGFKFIARLTFQNNTQSTATTKVPCPDRGYA